MDGADPRSGRAQPSHAESTAWLVVRLAAVLAVAGAAGVGAQAFADQRWPGTLLPALAGVVVACVLGGILSAMVIAPLARSRAQLTLAYREALADALRDPLTGLGNHRAFQEELDRQVASAQRYGVPLSLAIVDLDEFKQINDSGGHAGGDRALAAFGRLLATSVRRSDRCFRIGGDEFAILLPHTDPEGAKVVARRLLAAALGPALRSDDLEALSFSAGISALPELATTREQLYTQADTALYAAKRAGRTEVAVFDPATETAPLDASASAAVAEVIARGQLHPVYQPIVSVPDGSLLGYEGLIRPTEPAPFETPGALFAAAEASGHVVALDLACVELLVAGAASIPTDAFLSVNLSPRTVEAPEFSTAVLLEILARHGLPPQRLVIELTEQQPIVDVRRVREKLDACRRAGVRCAADDLGAGNAGLRMLSELRFDILKVDLSLVQRSAGGGPSSDVVESVVSLAARSGALVVGEGVEYPEQLDQLASLGVAAAQGYLLGRPGPLPEVEPMVARRAALGRPTPIRPGESDPVPVSAGMAAWRQSIGLPT